MISVKTTSFSKLSGDWKAQLPVAFESVCVPLSRPGERCTLRSFESLKKSPTNITLPQQQKIFYKEYSSIRPIHPQCLEPHKWEIIRGTEAALIRELLNIILRGLRRCYIRSMSNWDSPHKCSMEMFTRGVHNLYQFTDRSLFFAPIGPR